MAEVEIENKKMKEEDKAFKNSMLSSIGDENLPEDIKRLLSPGTGVKITEYNGKNIILLYTKNLVSLLTTMKRGKE